jgi:hypothetical protein
MLITSISIKELEHIKTSSNKDIDVKNSAHKILYELEKHPDLYEIILYKESFGDKMLADGYPLNNDTKIIACAREYKNTHPEVELIFITNDLICKYIA